MLKLCSPVFPLRNMLRISASSFHTGLSQQPPSALLQSTAVPNRSTSYRQQTLCLYSPFYDYHWPAAAMTLQLALEDVEALYLGWCCDDKCSQNTTSDITEYRASSLWIKVESVANQFTWHLNWKIFVKYFVHKNLILNVDVFVHRALVSDGWPHGAPSGPRWRRSSFSLLLSRGEGASFAPPLFLFLCVFPVSLPDLVVLPTLFCLPTSLSSSHVLIPGNQGQSGLPVPHLAGCQRPARHPSWSRRW